MLCLLLSSERVGTFVPWGLPNAWRRPPQLCRLVGRNSRHVPFALNWSALSWPFKKAMEQKIREMIQHIGRAASSLKIDCACHCHRNVWNALFSTPSPCKMRRMKKRRIQGENSRLCFSLVRSRPLPKAMVRLPRGSSQALTLTAAQIVVRWWWLVLPTSQASSMQPCVFQLLWSWIGNARALLQWLAGAVAGYTKTMKLEMRNSEKIWNRFLLKRPWHRQKMSQYGREQAVLSSLNTLLILSPKRTWVWCGDESGNRKSMRSRVYICSLLSKVRWTWK